MVYVHLIVRFILKVTRYFIPINLYFIQKVNVFTDHH